MSVRHKICVKNWEIARCKWFVLCGARPTGKIISTTSTNRVTCPECLKILEEAPDAKA